jgi:hypothetical protein
MKTINLLPLFFCLNALMAQDYQPFQQAFAYYYEHSGYNLDYVVAIDSNSVSGDTLFNYETIELCDGTFSPDPLGKGMSINSQQDSFHILRKDGLNILILSTTQQGDNWVLFEDTGIQYIATHSQSIQQNLWDEVLDSVKLFYIMALDSLGDTLAYSGVNSFTLSKRFGMTSYFDPNLFPNSPQLELKGVAGQMREWGDQWLDEWQIYDYEQGDEFHTEKFNRNLSQPSTSGVSIEWEDIKLSRNKILSAEKDSIGRKYLIERTEIHDYITKRFDGSNLIQSDTILNLSQDTIELSIEYHFPEYFPFSPDSLNSMYFYEKNGFYSSRRMPRMMEDFFWDSCYSEIIFTAPIPYDDAGIGEGFYFDSYLCTSPYYCTYFKPIYSNKSSDPQSDSTIFHTRYQQVLASNQMELNEKIQLYPNPCYYFLFFKNADSLNGSCKLMDMQGKIWGEWTLPREQINMSFLPSGIYVLSISSPKGNFQQKIVKK